MGELGVDLADRRPQMLTRELAERADVVVTMGCGDSCPYIPGKRYIDWDLADPKGRPVDEVRARDEIEQRVAGLVAELDSNWRIIPTFARTCECWYGGRMATERDTCDLLCLDLPKAEAVRHRLPSLAALEAWAGAAKALADPTRLAVAVALGECGTACVCDLAWIVGRDEKLISHHVRALRAGGLATSERQGKMAMYELSERGRAILAAVTAPAEAS